MLMTNMQRDAELKNLESALNDISDITEEISSKAGAKIEEINDTLNSKSKL